MSGNMHITMVLHLSSLLTTLMIIVTELVGSDLSDIVLRLGGFHTEMSFLGCIGHLMAASGLQDLLQLIYATNAVVHMLTGKAITRAVQGHLIVDAALNDVVLAKVFNVPLPGVTEASEDEAAEEEATISAIEGNVSTGVNAHSTVNVDTVINKLLANRLALCFRT